LISTYDRKKKRLWYNEDLDNNRATNCRYEQDLKNDRAKKRRYERDLGNNLIVLKNVVGYDRVFKRITVDFVMW